MMHQSVYHSQDIQAWEQRWFNQQNSDYGLMQQAAWSIAQRLISYFQQPQTQVKKIAVCCGSGNNAGDGYLLAKYLTQAGFTVDIYAAERGKSKSLNLAYLEAYHQQHADQSKLTLYSDFEFSQQYDAYIDALFGIGLNRSLDDAWQNIIQTINAQTGIKISIDIPSGLHANTGQPLPCAIKADITYSILALKAGLFTGKGKEYTGQIETIALIPTDQELVPIAQLSPKCVQLPQRQAFGHKGSYGHVLVIGGHAEMGGAVIMAAEAAFHAGAGKVTVVCSAKHHAAILARAPNIMIKDIDALDCKALTILIEQVDSISFGMGLGRDQWAKEMYRLWMPALLNSKKTLILDADALWFLASEPQQMHKNCVLTPHPGEAAKLLNSTVKQIESDRIEAIHALQNKYSGQWVLKGSGSLILQLPHHPTGMADHLNIPWICTVGNAGMGTGGMGDVLAGMIASLKAQFNDDIALHQIVTLHAMAGDVLAQFGMRGLQAHHMNQAIYRVVNQSNESVIAEQNIVIQ